MSPGLPFRQRVLPVLALAFAAPICGEFLQAYLPETGDVVPTLLALVILAPLYGGAALLIREVAVRSGRGWTGILILAAAFGVAMPGLVDLSLFGEHGSDVADWAAMRQATLIAPFGISAFPAISWVVGHVVVSIGAPLAVLDALAPRHRGRPLLGPWGVAVTATLCLLAAALIRADRAGVYGGQPPWTRTLVVLAIVAGLVVLALTPVGRPLSPGSGAPVRRRWLALIGAGSMFAVDILPSSWASVGVVVVILAVVGIVLRRWSISTDWSPSQTGALAVGALVGRTAIGFLAPVPDGVSLVAKLSQNSLLLAAVVAVAWLVLRRSDTAKVSGVGAGVAGR